MRIQFRVRPYKKEMGCYEAVVVNGSATSRIHAEENSLTAEEIDERFRHAFAQHFEVDESTVESIAEE